MPERRKPRLTDNLGYLPLALVVVFLLSAEGVWLTGGSASRDLAGWVEATATTLALLAAVVAVSYARGTYDLELERDVERLEVEERAQAVLVAAWAGTGNVVWDDLPDGGEFGMGKFVEGSPGDDVTVPGVWVRNASPLPIFAGMADITMTAYMPGNYQEWNLGVMELATIPPASRPRFTPYPAHLEGSRVKDAATWRADGYEVSYGVGLRFRDAAGSYWHRTVDGQLVAGQ
ncbi:hypothetical protein GCM10023350_09310 [Nocardioides endophyticus]|uniref:Uncharacterized protein n=1 Tax=Nocardioides endophyticus TaxID=1353775 RepID=A0ABP8YGG1_9ACTN